MNANAEPMVVDVVSDVVCPWCYLGKKRLEAALAEEAAPVAVRWRPFQLDPTIPAGGLDRKAYMARKFPDAARLKSVHEHLVRLGTAAGVAFAFDKIERAPNTLDAHRLIRWAQTGGAQDAVVSKLFEAYFVEGRDIGERAELIAIARECGLDADLVGTLIDEGADADAVRAEIAHAQSLGVDGVPFFIFANRLAVAGAQDVAVLRNALDQAKRV